MTESSVDLRREGAVTHLRMTRPGKGNSLSSEMVRAMGDAIARCGTDGTRALLLEGAAPNFCTGFDLSALESETDDTLLARFVHVELLLQQLQAAPFVTAAYAHGKAWGAGADLFVACDLRWAAPGTTFAFPGAGFGLVLGTGRLAACVGAARAGDWVLSGRQILVDEALAAGLAHALPGDQGVAPGHMLAAQLARVDHATQKQLSYALRARKPANDHADLARLVASAARPGLRQRIIAYRTASRPAP